MATVVVVHGAWSAAWAWRRMRPLMRALGHDLYTPMLTGLGERWHLSAPTIGLDTHIHDIIGVLEAEDLIDVTLVAHSYGGMVGTGVADRARARIRQMVYLDAFVPRDGQSLFDLQPPDSRMRAEEWAQRDGQGYLVPPNPPPPDTSADDIALMTPRRRPQPIGAFAQPLRLLHGEPAMPRTYIFCTRVAPADTFRQFATRAGAEPGWRHYELDASHNPHITMPETLAGLIDKIVREV
jgi:pimeloyl-ACP methyl ester carboxylesterase